MWRDLPASAGRCCAEHDGGDPEVGNAVLPVLLSAQIKEGGAFEWLSLQ
jgi:hypothetical protein